MGERELAWDDSFGIACAFVFMADPCLVNVEPNGDRLDFDNLYFSLREKDGSTFFRCFAERSWFYPLGERLSYLDDVAVPVKIIGGELPDPEQLNKFIAARLKEFPEMFECALDLYLEVIGEEDFRERLLDNEFSPDMVSPGDNPKLSQEDLFEVWKKRDSHRISQLEEVTFNSQTGHLAFFFRIDWEGYFEGYGFGLLISGDEVDYGIDQTYWDFCETPRFLTK